jgi:hypothetical protein
MPSVAASERGRAQTMMAYEPAGAVVMGLNGRVGEGSSALASATRHSRTLLERGAKAGESPVGDVPQRDVDPSREYRPTREIGWEAGGTTSQG